MCTAVLCIAIACAAPEQAALPVFPVKDAKAACEFWKSTLGIELALSEPISCPGGGALAYAEDRAAGVRLALLVPPVVQKPSPLPRACVRVPDIAAAARAFPDAPRFTADGVLHVLCADADGNFFLAAGRESAATALFNGKDLAGWRTFRTGAWSVKDGAIFGEQGPASGGGWLLTDALYKDFTLTFSFRISEGANSGVCVRYDGDGAPPQTAVEIQLSENDPEYRTGSFMGIRKAPDGLLKEGWNTASVTVQGNLVVSAINGKEAARETIARLLPEGRIGFQVHGTPKYAGMTVEIKDVMLAPR